MLEIYRKNSSLLMVNVTDEENNEYDCTGYIPYFSVKDNLSDTSYIFQISGTTSGATITFQLTSDMTDVNAGEYYFDITIIKSSENKRMTINLDKMKIINGVFSS